jgi:hypothetical protein
VTDVGRKDGTSKTLLIVEAGTAVPWTKPLDLVVPVEGSFPKLGGLFPIGFQAVMCDGSVRQFSKDIYADEPRLRAMSGYQDGVLFQFSPYARIFQDLERQQVRSDTTIDGALNAATAVSNAEQQQLEATSGGHAQSPRLSKHVSATSDLR